MVASDIAERACLVARGLVANADVRLDAQALLTFAGAKGDPADLPDDVGRRLTARQAEWLAGALAAADAWPEPRRSLGRLAILKHFLGWFPMSQPGASDAPAAATGAFDRISPARLGHYVRAQRGATSARLRALIADVNTGVFGGTGTAARGDARDALPMTAAEVMYLDPPLRGDHGLRAGLCPR